MRVFVTGGMGFIGSYIVMELLGNGHEVSVLARNPAKVKAIGAQPGVTVVHGELADTQIVARGLAGHDACIHNALIWVDDPVALVRGDVLQSIQLFEICANAGVRQVIYTSSMAALGDYRAGMHENLAAQPANFYGATKAATECYLLAFSRSTTMRCNIVRPGFTIGNPVIEGAPIYSSDTLTRETLNEVVRCAVAGEDIRVAKAAGKQFIWAGDLAKVYSAMLTSSVNRCVYHALATDFTTWERVACKAVEIAGTKSRVLVEESDGNAARPVVDVSKIKQEFGLEFSAWDRVAEHLDYLVQREAIEFSQRRGAPGSGVPGSASQLT